MTSVFKFNLILFFLIIGSLVSKANDNNFLLSLQYIDDDGKPQTAYVKLTDKPKVSFTATQLEISGLNIALLYDQVTAINVVDAESTSIDHVAATDDKIPQIIFLNSSILQLSGISKGTIVKLYSLEGKMVSQDTASNDSIITISLSQLPKGAYIVRTNQKSFKIIKK